MATIIYENENGLLSAIEFDVTGNETPTFTATPTAHPVEAGADITDHVHPELVKVELEGLITNTPLNETALVDPYFTEGAVLGQNTPFTLAIERKRRLTYAQVVGGTPGPGAVLMDALGLPSRVNGLPRTFVPAVATPATYVNEPVVLSGRSFQPYFQTDRVKVIFEALEKLVTTGTEVRLLTRLKEYPSMVITSVVAPSVAEDSINFTISLTELRYAEVGSGVLVRRKKPKEKRAETNLALGPTGLTYKTFEAYPGG